MVSVLFLWVPVIVFSIFALLLSFGIAFIIYIFFKYILKFEDNNWRNISIAGTIILVTANLIGSFSGVTFPIMMGPDVSDYGISCNPVYLQIVIPDSLINEEIAAKLNNTSIKRLVWNAYRINISANDLNPMRKYNQQIYLKLFNSPKFTTSIPSPVLKVDQSSELRVITCLNELHIGESYPITIQSIGADGKNRNCTLFIKVISEDESNPPRYQNNYGVDLFNRGMYNESITAFDKAIEIDPQCVEAWSNRGTALARLGKYNDALESFDKATAINPRYAAAWSYKGHVLENLSRYYEAIRAYDEAIKIDPHDSESWYDKGSLLANLSRYNESIQAFDKAIEINPQDTDAWNNKGSILGVQGKYNDAIQSFNNAIEINPQDATVWYNKGLALKSLKQTTEADAAFAKAKKLGYTG